ncbi:fused uroporphyrinogen-III synthase HemD/membrane protein HemX [Cupriavidus gilardii]|uniref:fused uroporphyrinogen-III synthase HemD/membrane protein HemX n=1 Tax=Cupriavidus gilardii TaxID=82541 RepID=UPI001EE5276C|nr:fused uroporphyrinogen-III synthase HemD/membrane protein HemX [Cupriavidus gilardii]MCG5261394.1 fused uroporphyrinogen-III synthase HemD/membrane protein HemX [Cupriavidus gilardii]MDF9430609.1 fused uroporphyrinogen-III synthase HemD/membrane protein HemX [Cupriavidus gilardii]
MPRPTVVVTRPAGQSRQLTEALQAAGVDVLSFPLLAIGPAADDAPLRAALARLPDFALVVFVSPNAIAHALDALALAQGGAALWPESVPVAVVGPASVAALGERGIAAPRHRVISPAGADGRAADLDPADARFDSEALWAQLDVPALAGREVLIVRGNGGRDWLGDQLREAGATVLAVEAYQRTMPVPGSMQWQAVRDGLKPGAPPQAWLLTSSEAVRNLDRLALDNLSPQEDAALREVQCIAPHARIAEQAATLGFTRVLLAAPGDEGLLAACLRWAEPYLSQLQAASKTAAAAALQAASQSGPQAGSQAGPQSVSQSASQPASKSEAGATAAPVSAPAPAAQATATGPAGQSQAPSITAGTAASAAPATPGNAPAASAPTTPTESPPSTSTKVDRVTQQQTSTASSTPPPAGMPPGAAPSGVSPGERPSPRGRGSLAWLLLAILVLVAGGAFWWLQQRVDRLTEELARRQQTNDALVQESRVLTREAQTTVKEMQAKVGALEAQVGETRDKQATLEQVYQDLMRNRDDWEIAEIQQLLTNAGQQLQLTGNVQVALSALQSADVRLARSDKPEYNQLRRAIARDIGRLKAMPDTDLTGAAIKLDEAINQIDALPLLSSERMLERSEGATRGTAAASQPGAASAAAAGDGDGTGNRVTQWFAGVWATVRDELMRVIRVRRVDDTEALLLTGDQGWFLRENVKLRLLNARLALLSRNEQVFRNDLAAAHGMIERYFDTKSRRVQAVQTLLKQAQAGAVAVQLPTMADSLGALRSLKKE